MGAALDDNYDCTVSSTQALCGRLTLFLLSIIPKPFQLSAVPHFMYMSERLQFPLLAGVHLSWRLVTSNKYMRNSCIKLWCFDNIQTWTWCGNWQRHCIAYYCFLSNCISFNIYWNVLSEKFCKYVCSISETLHCVTFQSEPLSVSVSRLEDKESETKKEYSKLHERYTDVRIYSLLH